MHYPEQRPIVKLAVIQRRVTLPEQASGLVTVLPDQRVDVRDVVVRGLVPGEHLVLDAKAYFRLRKAEDLAPLLRVRADDEVDEITVLAGKESGRGRKLYSPVRGRVAAIVNGLILIEQLNDVLDLEAGVRGRVSDVQSGRGAVIEASGAYVQGFWGNGQRAIAVLRGEASTALEDLDADQFSSPFHNVIVVVRRGITQRMINAARNLGVSGLVGPSMPVSLLGHALGQPFPIMLTEAFGETRVNRTLNQWLIEHEGSQVVLDAFEPTPWDTRRPEIVMTIAPKPGETPVRPNLMLTLRPGMTVRVIGAPYTGMSGVVLNLPSDPVLLDNGMRFVCAQVELSSGERIFAPLANIEVSGR
ncbi:MAG: hypothetical protein IPM16_02915 [Chloroflexi bacterium]|nr:hypothetical protein [Chloroflexota bacterium]